MCVLTGVDIISFARVVLKRSVWCAMLVYGPVIDIQILYYLFISKTLHTQVCVLGVQQHIYECAYARYRTIGVCTANEWTGNTREQMISDVGFLWVCVLCVLCVRACDCVVNVRAHTSIWPMSQSCDAVSNSAAVQMFRCMRCDACMPPALRQAVSITL